MASNSNTIFQLNQIVICSYHSFFVYWIGFGGFGGVTTFAWLNFVFRVQTLVLSEKRSTRNSSLSEFRAGCWCVVSVCVWAVDRRGEVRCVSATWTIIPRAIVDVKSSRRTSNALVSADKLRPSSLTEYNHEECEEKAVVVFILLSRNKI